ncbi:MULTISPECIES: hypothetical protein [Halobacterium]|uniref:hypothetical protein n=1 Tax=Halobacterium TaxID=2239 RepID=UPI00073E83E2|nr:MULTISPECIES: hypothetical protein [Halobacterium]MCG1002155.1 hypothetical protein [Halobacterium noricense]
MATGERGLDSWLSATVDMLLAVFGFALVWYPMVSLGNAALGFPVSPSTGNLVAGVLTLGGSYPVVAGDWSLRQLGEYISVLVISGIGWGLVGMIVILALGVSFSGSSHALQAAVWAPAYLTAYLVVYRTKWSVFS